MVVKVCPVHLPLVGWTVMLELSVRAGAAIQRRNAFLIGSALEAFQPLNQAHWIILDNLL